MSYTSTYKKRDFVPVYLWIVRPVLRTCITVDAKYPVAGRAEKKISRDFYGRGLKSDLSC